ncbi:MAG: phospholipase C [Acidobacteriaceae bacterium]
MDRTRRTGRANRSGRLSAAIALTALLAFLFFVPAANAQDDRSLAARQRREIARHILTRRQDPPVTPEQLRTLVQKRVRYVFVIYQENRSFDSYFGSFPGAEGLYSRRPQQTLGFTQTIHNTDGATTTIRPFRIGPEQYAADLDDVDHSHTSIVAKMDIQDNLPRMDRFALTEELRYSPTGRPSLRAKQFAELTMAHEDCDTVPLLWNYADRFVLFDHIFQEMIGPSTLGNLSIIGAQTGQTQWALHPEQAYKGNGDVGPGVPVLNDDGPFWGSQQDKSANKMPVNPRDLQHGAGHAPQINLTYATLPLTLQGAQLAQTVQTDKDPEGDLGDVADDVKFISGAGMGQVPFGWFEEGYDKEVTDPDDGPVDAEGMHASYVTHHNGPQYFGYVSNNPAMRAQLHGLGDFFHAVDARKLPAQGGVFFVKGGFQNLFGMAPVDPDPAAQKTFRGDDDHPGYSDAQISEAMVATAINKIAASPYWKQSVILVTWDDSEGQYDHVPPPVRAYGPDGSPITDGPRVPLLFISPFARAHFIAHAEGNHASVVKFLDVVFQRTPLALLPDERKGRRLGEQEFHQKEMGPQDALTPDVTDLLDAFSPARLAGRAPLLPAAYVRVPEAQVRNLPQTTGLGCAALGIVPTDRALGIQDPPPVDFNPRPKTQPTPTRPRLP